MVPTRGIDFAALFFMVSRGHVAIDEERLFILDDQNLFSFLRKKLRILW